MLATESHQPEVQLRVHSVPSPRDTRDTMALDHQATVLIADNTIDEELFSSSSVQPLIPALPATNGSFFSPLSNMTATVNLNALLDETDARTSDLGIPRDSKQQEIPFAKINITPTVSAKTKVKNSEKVVYGELVVLGYNGSLLGGDSGRKRSKFVLYKRQTTNGVKPSNKQFFSKPGESKSGELVHTVSYTLSRTQALVVEYEKDESTDMFQIGRSSESQIDFVVTDTIPGDQRLSGQNPIAQSTISRFSCRICVEREPPYAARIYAAGFDQQNHIFLGEKASKWYNQYNEMDGLTTNGVLIVHPKGDFNGGDCQPGQWREVSVRGDIYSLRETRSVPSKSQRIETESNILLDGTIIDLCGATLVWRSCSGLDTAPTNKMLEEYIELINASRPQCPVGLNTLVLPKRNAKIEKSKQPYVYLACGHVHGEHNWGKEATGKRTCPMCLKEGTFVRVQVGCEASLYTDNEPLTHAFKPCAHMTSEKTARYWSSVAIPFGCQGFRTMCPFCATPLSGPGTDGFIKLIFQDNTEF